MGTDIHQENALLRKTEETEALTSGHTAWATELKLQP